MAMRFVVTAAIPVEKGNKMIKDPKFLKTLEEYINKIKAEASYFYEKNGMRTFTFIIDISNADEIPLIAEPLFQRYNANVEFHPAMIFTDLKKSIKSK